MPLASSVARAASEAETLLAFDFDAPRLRSGRTDTADDPLPAALAQAFFTWRGYHHGVVIQRKSPVKSIAIPALAIALSACGHGASDSGGAVTLVNADFEQTANDGSIPGWDVSQHAGTKAYEVRIEADGAFQGHGSLRMTRTHEQVYGSVSQRVAAKSLVGRAIEFSAMLRTRDVGARGWKLFISGNAPGTLAYSHGVTGTSGWQRQTVRLTVAPNVRDLSVGVILLDGGTGWMDNAELRVVDE